MKKLNFKDFVSGIKNDIKGKRDFKSHVGTLDDFVAHELYRSVKTDRNEVSELTLSNLLGLDFGEDIDFIIGKLTEKYIDDHYVLDRDIKFKDADGTLHENPNIGGNISWKGSEKQKTRELLSEFIHKYLITDETDSLNYLGLEGPNFRSFLELAYSAKEKDVEINGTFVEYDNRTYNLMESIINSKLGKEVFKNSKMIFGDINTLLPLDFVKDPEVKFIVNRKYPWNTDHGGIIEQKRDMVQYQDVDIDYEYYQAILDDIDKEGLTTQEILDKRADMEIHKKHYSFGMHEGLEEPFIEMMMDRHEEKFDVVFLDYMGGVTDRFLWSLEQLIQRRVTDNAIVAVVHNRAPHRKVKELDKENTFVDSLNSPEEEIINPNMRIQEIFERTQYNHKSLTEGITYRGENGSQQMYFQAWYVERNRDEE
tara:strand:+ start:3542 stop:4813 length:1272 start_codon:yes stop_codon:yes gene_type:complete